MSSSRAENLIEKLISNRLSGDELSELLAGINNDEEQQAYSDALEVYFKKLLDEEQKINQNNK